ncbi:MAG: hypothetical protein HS104_22330 [Polyangiaceae bacterium]|nr:hypothetical protein [Polyangiaceae bacterium]MCE7891095.1 hypothetical protein [Sorangiineae bacterium PRO1]MCL4750026.1 hypothetical protein [Myxococcales bacterium]
MRSRLTAFGLLVASNAAATPPVIDREPELGRAAPLVIATDGQPPPPPPSWPRPERRRWHQGVALGVGFGAAFVEGVEQGYWARIDAGAYDIQHRRRGFIGGMLTGLEGWRANGEAWGASLPLILFLGIQSDAFFSTLGGGFDVVLVDRVDQTTGYGFFAPEADLKLGFDLEGVRFLANARAGYHWQLGADDRGSLRFGGEIQLTTD